MCCQLPPRRPPAPEGRGSVSSAPSVSASLEVDQAQLNRLFVQLVRIGEVHGVRFPREVGALGAARTCAVCCSPFRSRQGVWCGAVCVRCVRSLPEHGRRYPTSGHAGMTDGRKNYLIRQHLLFKNIIKNVEVLGLGAGLSIHVERIPSMCCPCGATLMLMGHVCTTHVTRRAYHLGSLHRPRAEPLPPHALPCSPQSGLFLKQHIPFTPCIAHVLLPFRPCMALTFYAYPLRYPAPRSSACS